MIEKRGNIFYEDCDALCITTNGYVKKNGEAVMGKGCALQAAQVIPNLPAILGYHIKNRGNNVHLLTTVDGLSLLSFPVKQHLTIYTEGVKIVSHMLEHFTLGDVIPGWALMADIKLIQESCKQLVQITDAYLWKKVVLPRPGCGAGELKWEEVKPVLEEYLDDRFSVMTY